MRIWVMSMSFKGGIKEAAKLLMGLLPEKRMKVLRLMQKINPQLALQIGDNLYEINDILRLETRSFNELLKSVAIIDLALSFKLSTEEDKNSLLKRLPKLNQQEFNEVLYEHKVSKDKVLLAQSKILKILGEQIDSAVWFFENSDRV